MIETGKSRLFWLPEPVDLDARIVFDDANVTAKLISEHGVTDMVEIKGVSTDGLTVTASEAYGTPSERTFYRLDLPALFTTDLMLTEAGLAWFRLMGAQLLRERDRRRAVHREYRRRQLARARRRR